MIDRYSLSLSAESLRQRYAVDVPEFYAPLYNAAPTMLLPVITSASPGGLSLFYWGTSPDWAKNKVLAEKLVNVRRENFQDRPSLRKSLKKNRCIIPADGFFGWKKIGKKSAIPYRFIFKNRDSFSIAGLWEEFEDTNGQELQTFTMITLPATELVAGVQDRMPAILLRHSELQWLDNSSPEEQLIEMLSTAEVPAMDYYPVSPGIADASKNLPSLIAPSPPSDQHGNLTLFD